MPNPRVSDDIKRRRGTYRADRAEDAPTAEAENEALALYKDLARDTFKRALGGSNVIRDLEYLRQAEAALYDNGIATHDGSQWNMSKLVEIAQR